MTTAHDVLEEPLLSWRSTSGKRGLSHLPGLLEKLGRRELLDFPRLRPHQYHPWGMFLAQLAAIALHRAGEEDVEIDADAWRERLLRLTKGEREPWCLCVEDVRRSAFFQPGVPEGTTKGWKGVAETPDDIDILVTTKAHDVKTSLVSGADVESWIYALVTLQTTQGYPGRGYNGIARMKGGYGNRARVGLSPDHVPSSRFVRDVKIILGAWPRQLDRGFCETGASLVWALPWDGSRSFAFRDLTPHFIEVCWRIRLEKHPDGTLARYATTGVRRCLPEVTNGDVGDPWIPIEGEHGALTVAGRGFEYGLVTTMLFSGEFGECAAQKPLLSDEGDMELHLAAMARGQGKTQGLHERVLSVDRKIRKRLGDASSRSAFAARAMANVQMADVMRRRVLYPGLRLLALGEETVKDDFHRRVDEVFFEHLFDAADHTEDEARLGWLRHLAAIAEHELHRAIDAACLPSSRRLRAISDSERMFRRCLRKQFPDLFVTKTREPEED